MNIKVVDFEILTKNYTNYQTGIKNIEEEKKEFIKSLDPVKKEMESIISQMSSGLIMDEQTQKEKEDKFRSLQEQAMNIDNQFKVEMRRLHDELNKKTFDELFFKKLLTKKGATWTPDLVNKPILPIIPNVVFQLERDQLLVGSYLQYAIQ